MNTSDPIDVEKMIENLRPQADQAFYLTLRRRVLSASADIVDTQESPMKRILKQFTRSRIWQPLAIGVLLVFLFLTLTPFGQAFAQRIIHLGVFFVTREPTPAERSIQDPPNPAEVQTLESLAISPEFASETAGFPVYYPEYLPDGYRPLSSPAIELVPNSRGEIVSAGAMFGGDQGNHILHYTQSPFPPDADLSSVPLDAGAAIVQEVSVGGNEALWLENYIWGTQPDGAGELAPVEYNVLIWTLPASGGSKYYFWLGSEAQLLLDEMLQVAESMAAE